MTALSLGSAPSGGSPRGGSPRGGSPRGALAPLSARGSAAAEGITNPGRLLGLGLALGIGAEVFGAPTAAPAAGGTDAAADLSPLSPLMSKSQMRKLQRRASRGSAGAAGAAGAAMPAELPGAGAQQPHQQQPGRKGRPGRSKAERRNRSGAAAAAAAAAAAGSSEDAGDAMQQRFGGLGLGAPAGGAGGSPEGPPGRLAAAPSGSGSDRPLVAGDYGFFEKHTTGIGSKLLAKWGFAGEGAGLGRSQQGRAEPLQAVRRAKKLGLGAEGI